MTDDTKLGSFSEEAQGTAAAIQSATARVETEFWTYLIIYLVIQAIICMLLGAWVAAKKGRSRWEGALLGLLFAELGVLIEALLPNMTCAVVDTAESDWRAHMNQLAIDQLNIIREERDLLLEIESELRRNHAANERDAKPSTIART